MASPPGLDPSRAVNAPAFVPGAPPGLAPTAAAAVTAKPFVPGGSSSGGAAAAAVTAKPFVPGGSGSNSGLAKSASSSSLTSGAVHAPIFVPGAAHCGLWCPLGLQLCVLQLCAVAVLSHELLVLKGCLAPGQSASRLHNHCCLRSPCCRRRRLRRQRQATCVCKALCAGRRQRAAGGDGPAAAVTAPQARPQRQPAWLAAGAGPGRHARPARRG